MIINYFQKRTVSSIIINNHIIHLGPGDGQTMIESGGIVKPMPAPATGASWVVDKNSAGIPYVTDGTTKKWCMSYFQVTPKEPGASSSLGELPSLEVDGDNGPPPNNTPAPIATLPGKLTFLVNVVYIFRFNVFCFFDFENCMCDSVGFILFSFISTINIKVGLNRLLLLFQQ